MEALKIPTFVIGPALGARRSEVLAQSEPAADLTAGERQRLLEVPLILAGWMRSGEPELYACIPLGPDPEAPRLLVRATYLGELNGEPLGFANAMLANRSVVSKLAGHVERLLPWLAAPDRNSDFAAASIRIELGELAASPRGVVSGVEWCNSCIVIADRNDPIDVIQTVLAGMAHRPQDRRVVGWATSAAVPTQGTFVPGTAFQLLVVRSRAAAPQGYRELNWINGSLDTEPTEPPPAWHAWQRLTQLVQAVPELALLSARSGWAFALADCDPAQLPFKLLQRAIAVAPQGLELAIKLIEALRRNSQLGSLVVELLEWLNSAPAERGAILSALLAQDLQHAAGYGIVEALAGNPQWAAELTVPAFAQLVELTDWPDQVRIAPDLAAALGEPKLLLLFARCASGPGPGHLENLKRCFYYFLARGSEPTFRREEFAAGLTGFLSIQPAVMVPPQQLESLVNLVWTSHPELTGMVAERLLHVPRIFDHDAAGAMLIRACSQFVRLGTEQGGRGLLSQARDTEGGRWDVPAVP